MSWHRYDMTSTGTPTAGARRRGYATGEAAREKILDAATDAFSERGFRGASLAEIGRAAGMTQQGVLYHFPTKARLLAAVLEERDKRDMRSWHDDQLVGIGVLDAWDATVERNVRLYGLVRLAHVLTAEVAGDEHPARDYFVDHFSFGFDMLLAAFQAGVERGELRTDVDYAVVARQIIAMSEGLETQWLVDPDGVDIVACFHDFTQQLRERIRR